MLVTYTPLGESQCMPKKIESYGEVNSVKCYLAPSVTCGAVCRRNSRILGCQYDEMGCHTSGVYGVRCTGT